MLSPQVTCHNPQSQIFINSEMCKKLTARMRDRPFKKKSGVIAGIARERSSPVGYGGMPDHREDENDDVCSACGGQGTLLCCDGCTSSFHFTCVDPPMEQEDLKDDEAWYCCICIARRDPPHKQPRGIFASLLDNLEKKNPMSFNLPKDLREYFEGVKTGDEGEYEEAVTQKSRTRGGYEEEPDLLKLKDTKGKVVLCFRCGKSAINGQKIIPCDFCNLHWHLDCLDPPLANPPPRAPNGKPKHNWMCPNHVDHELLAVDPSVKAYGRLQSCNGGLRTHKVRRPKNARIIDTHLRRGFANNGLIEIENDPSDDEEHQFFQQNHFGIVYRLPEKGIKLDFIAKVRSVRESETRTQTQTHSSASSQALESVQQDVDAVDAQMKREFGKRSAVEQTAAINLVHFAQMNTDLDINLDKFGVLIDTLIAEAPPEAKAIFGESGHKSSMIPPSPPSSDSRPDQPESVLSVEERNTLLMIQELIRRRLESAPTTG
ncbi:MAG: hypothetical protein M1813_003453 [Trichoglossum hirsutum]|nr:MAG: hypothetical protein M1813_003453 [Trichoglossum hirsutum]